MVHVEFTLKVPTKIKKKGNIYISSCEVLDINTQGYSKEEAKSNLLEALKLFISSCFERGTLDEVLKDCGFKLQTKATKPSRRSNPNLMSVPIPFTAKGACLSACHV